MTIPKWVLFLGVCASLVNPHHARAQRTDPKLRDKMLDCTMHEKVGPWVPKDLRGDGLLRFNYLHELPTSKNSANTESLDSLYVVFWNPSKTKGEFLHFTLDRTNPRQVLTITNDGQIDYSKGKLDFDFFQGGLWVRDQYILRVRRLHAAPIQALPVASVRRTGVLCDSLAHFVIEWHTQSPVRH